MRKPALNLGVAILTVICAPLAFAQDCRNLPGALLPCPPGPWGPGGCYNPGSYTCVNGRMCPSPLRATANGCVRAALDSPTVFAELAARTGMDAPLPARCIASAGRELRSVAVPRSLAPSAARSAELATGNEPSTDH